MYEAATYAHIQARNARTLRNQIAPNDLEPITNLKRKIGFGREKTKTELMKEYVTHANTIDRVFKSGGFNTPAQREALLEEIDRAEKILFALSKFFPKTNRRVMSPLQENILATAILKESLLADDVSLSLAGKAGYDLKILSRWVHQYAEAVLGNWPGQSLGELSKRYYEEKKELDKVLNKIPPAPVEVKEQLEKMAATLREMLEHETIKNDLKKLKDLERALIACNLAMESATQLATLKPEERTFLELYTSKNMAENLSIEGDFNKKGAEALKDELVIALPPAGPGQPHHEVLLTDGKVCATPGALKALENDPKGTIRYWQQFFDIAEAKYKTLGGITLNPSVYVAFRKSGSPEQRKLAIQMREMLIEAYARAPGSTKEDGTWVPGENNPFFTPEQRMLFADKKDIDLLTRAKARRLEHLTAKERNAPIANSAEETAPGINIHAPDSTPRISMK